MSSILVQVIVGGLLLGAVYALFSSGLTLVWGMMNIVNFAHGDFVMLGMYVAFVVWTLFGAGPWAGAPLAVLVLATLGVIVYFGLIRDIMKGPMLAQILGTFGLALLLRYSVFWWFGANFLSLPENLVGGTFDVMGLRIQASRLLAGVVALLVTLGLHLLLTRTSLGSKMLAVAEDSTAAQLMGIRPDSMQAIAWAIAAGATGLAGALIATFFYIVPTVGETLGIVAFVTVSLGGFGSVPGALVAGLADRRHRIPVGLPDRRGLQGHGRVRPVPRLPLVPAAGPDGQDVMRRLFVALRCCSRFSSPIRWCSRRRSSSGSARWCCSMRSRLRPGTSSAAMPARYRSAMSCSSVAAPTPRWALTPISPCRRWWEFPRASS